MYEHTQTKMAELSKRIDTLQEELHRRTRRPDAWAARALDEVEALRDEAATTRGRARRRWSFRLQVLRSYYEHSGHMARTARALSVYRSRIYRHRAASRLFDDCVSYVKAWCSRHRSESRPWLRFWPDCLDVPEILDAIGAEPLREDLVIAGAIMTRGPSKETQMPRRSEETT